MFVLAHRTNISPEGGFPPEACGEAEAGAVRGVVAGLAGLGAGGVSASSRTAPAHHSTAAAVFRLRTPAPVKNSLQEARRGVFSIGVDPKYLEIHPQKRR